MATVVPVQYTRNTDDRGDKLKGAAHLAQGVVDVMRVFEEHKRQQEQAETFEAVLNTLEGYGLPRELGKGMGLPAASELSVRLQQAREDRERTAAAESAAFGESIKDGSRLLKALGYGSYLNTENPRTYEQAERLAEFLEGRKNASRTGGAPDTLTPDDIGALRELQEIFNIPKALVDSLIETNSRKRVDTFLGKYVDDSIDIRGEGRDADQKRAEEKEAREARIVSIDATFELLGMQPPGTIDNIELAKEMVDEHLGEKYRRIGYQYDRGQSILEAQEFIMANAPVLGDLANSTITLDQAVAEYNRRVEKTDRLNIEHVLHRYRMGEDENKETLSRETDAMDRARQQEERRTEVRRSLNRFDVNTSDIPDAVIDRVDPTMLNYETMREDDIEYFNTHFEQYKHSGGTPTGAILIDNFTKARDMLYGFQLHGAMHMFRKHQDPELFSRAVGNVDEARGEALRFLRELNKIHTHRESIFTNASPSDMRAITRAFIMQKNFAIDAGKLLDFFNSLRAEGVNINVQ